MWPPEVVALGRLSLGIFVRGKVVRFPGYLRSGREAMNLETKAGNKRVFVVRESYLLLIRLSWLVRLVIMLINSAVALSSMKTERGETLRDETGRKLI